MHPLLLRARVVTARPLVALGLVASLTSLRAAGPEPVGWFSGDMHVHRSCGTAPVPVSQIFTDMTNRDLAVVSLLADSGNGEVQNATTDLPKVNGGDDPSSTASRIIHWDVEWHWDPIFTQYAHQVLGGHIVQLGMTSAQTTVAEYTFQLFQQAHQQNAIAGFAHFQYLGDGFPTTLDCCTPLEYPVEVALGSCDFISEDVTGSDSAIRAYYRLLNCGFRPGWAGGSDYPCSAAIGDVITYVKVANGLTYRKWIDGIKAGHTVVSRNAHNEFLDFSVNASAGPGDEIQLPAGGGNVQLAVQWSANQALAGTIELVRNGVVIASVPAAVDSTHPATVNVTAQVPASSWIVARRMSDRGHEVHTAAVFVTVGGAPVRASVDDANFYVAWMDELLVRTSPGGPWNQFFPTSLAAAQARYQSARAVFQQIAADAAANQPLTIGTTSLADGTVGQTYSATLAATGGHTPYAWSVVSGTLPGGLTLNAATGALTGTPTTLGTSAFTVGVTDTSTPTQTVTQALSLRIAGSSALTIWPSSAVPAVVDGGPDGAVELGVRFRSDVAGTVTGVRFYKAAANTGTHVGNLWTATGTLLASATFNSESASGWQQVAFATPVSINANTDYVVSYHCDNGHYSGDGAAFASAGVNSPPLHVPVDSVATHSSLYRYGALSAFPNQSWNATNYWVDVTFRAASTPTLVAVAVNPSSASLTNGATRQLTAVGTYSDGTTADLTTQVTWSSADATKVTVNSSGLATAVGVGSTSVSAALNSLSGSCNLTVTASPLALSTTTVPGGTVGSAYSTALAATGGNGAYHWSVTAGALPPGLSLGALTGVISGTPTTASTYGFTVTVTDSGSPVQSVSRAFTLVVAAAPTQRTIWSSATVPAIVDGGPDGSAELGVKFRSDAAGFITGLRFYKASTNTGTHVASLWSSAGALLATATFNAETASGWQQVLFASPVAITANTVYVASYHATTGHYSATLSYFATAGFDNAPLHALANGVSGPNGVYQYGPTSVFPTQTWNSTNYWVDVVFTQSNPPTLSSLVVTPANPTVVAGATRQFAATASYSDGSAVDVTTQAAWTSTNTAVATIGAATGLATGVTAGSTLINASFASINSSTSLTVQPPTLTITTASLPAGTAGVAYSATVAASGGTTPYAWSVSAGALPTGLSLNAATGAISGTPTTAGTSTFGLTVLDAATPAQTKTQVFSITITATLTAIAVTPVNPSNVAGTTRQFVATATYSDGTTQDVTSVATWTSSSTAVATITSAGLATGQSAGTSTIAAKQGAITGSTTLTVTPPPLTITTSSLAGGTVNLTYTATLAASGGTPAYTWSLALGTLPTGLALAPTTGAITGTPTASGTFSFTVRATDAANPAQIVTKPLSIVVAAAVTRATIWAANAVPIVADGGPDSPVELGVKFRSDVSGFITGVRFYKAPTNTGVHVASLWTSTGTLLATAPFAGELASGWQEVTFSSPVAITANTIYVASYHVNGGHYSADSNAFASAGVDRPPLHALANTVGEPNGVYQYGAGSTFPTQTWNSANYWVDVVFQSGTNTPGDHTPPAVVGVVPTSGASAVTPGSTVTVTFSEAMDPATITTASIVLRDGANAVVPATVTYLSASNSAVLTPITVLAANAPYAATVRGGAGGVADTSGNTLAADFAWTFTTIGSDPYGTGPGGPVLVVTNPGDPFTRYVAEILLAEGLNAFALSDLSTVSAATLSAYDVVILGQTSLTAAQVTMFTNWVNGGGNLVALRPDKQLAGLLGLTDAGGTLANAYLLVNTAATPGAGITGQTMQFHGTADRYTLSGATSVATLYAGAQTPTANPAATLRTVGANGGHAAAFTYDLARSIVYTRQGNPAWSGQERDGAAPIRPNDLFFGNASFDPQPDWVDLDKVQIPQADEQQRLLANLVISMNAARRPLPRFHYFPRGLPAVIIMTGDDHATGGTAGRFQEHLAMSQPGDSVEDWQAIRSTSYIYPAATMTDAQAAAFNAAGFEIGLHLNTNQADYTAESGNQMLTDQLEQFTSVYPSLPATVTERVHAIAWSGYTTMAELEWQHGIRLDTTYYYWPGAWVADRPGFMTGSGLAMRFATASGNALDVYQANTEMTDESNQTYPFTVDTLLDRALGPEGYYGAFVANMHTDEAISAPGDAIILSAVSRGVPVIAARQLLTWVDARNSSSFQSISWANNTLTFTVQANANARGLLAMVPIPDGRTVTGVLLNGIAVPYTLKTMKGVSYATLTAINGTYTVTMTPDLTPPVVTAVSPVNGATNVSVLSPVTVTFNKPMSAASINATTVRLLDAASAAVAATVTYDAATLTATLQPTAALAGSQAYSLVVTGSTAGVKDAGGTALASDFVATFTTVATSTQTYSIWANTVTPGTVTVPDANAVEVGVKFRTSTSGYITGVRYYKSSANTGTHVGTIWSATGTPLASVTFTNETASGWQTQALAAPLAVTAGTTYVASYHTNTGNYSADTGYFATSGVTATPLRALAEGEDGSNGVYRYGASAFPNQTWNSSNYWVDVVFKFTP